MELKIAINGGHYPGFDDGAVGAYTTEAEVARVVMKLARGYLEKVGYEVLAVQQRRADEVARRVQAFRAKLFVAIHCGASVSKLVSGARTHYADDASRALAERVQSQIVRSVPAADLGVVKDKRLGELPPLACTSALVELAHITNRFDEQLLIGKRDTIARALARGITDYVAAELSLGGDGAMS